MTASTLSSVNFSLGPRSTPQDVKDLRKSTWDYHRTYGMPVVHKHKWNARDVRNGLARKCPYHNMPGYEADYTHCPYCFGTGILGGWADGQIAYVTFSDAQENRIKVGPQGVLLFDREPQMVAPWLPEMGNGDLLVTADFDDNTFDVIDEKDRFTLNEVTPVTIRGFQKKVQTVEYRVNQQAMVDRVPDGDYLYEIPLVFDYNDLPDIPNDPNAPGVQTSTTRSLGIVGIESQGFVNTVRALRIFGAGTDISVTRGISIVGVSPNPGDVDVFFPPEQVIMSAYGTGTYGAGNYKTLTGFVTSADLGYKVRIKEEIIDALRASFESADFPNRDIIGNVKITLDYPMDEVHYPAIMVELDERVIQMAGVGHYELGEDEIGNVALLAHWRFEGSIKFTIFGLSSADRDILSSALVNMIAFPGANNAYKTFHTEIYDGEFIDMQISSDHIIPGGDSVTDVPWDAPTRKLYQATYSLEIMGEFFAVHDSGVLVTLDDVNIYPYRADQPEPIGSTNPKDLNEPWS